MEFQKTTADHVQQNTTASLKVADTSKLLTDDARQATDTEHNLTFLQAIRVYRKAVMWSVIVSMAIVMESYDTQIIGSFSAYPSFQQKYGVQLPNGSYSIQAQWQVALGLAATIGIIIGIFLNGILVERYGHKNVMLVAYVFMTAFIFIPFFSQNIQVLFVGELLSGLPWGIFNTIAPGYAAEVCPTVLRSYLTTYVNLCWVIGHLIAAGVLDSLVTNTTQWSYRIPFAIQWIWPVPLFFLLCFAPDSPWWLVRKHRYEDAEKALLRLSSSDDRDTVDVKQTLAMMVYTNQLEKDMQVQGSYLDCFKGVDLRRTEIACITWGTQTIVGFAIQSYTTYFFTLAGLSPTDSYKLTLGVYTLAFLGTVCSWILQSYLGRRTIFLIGLAFLSPVMWTIGFLALATQTSAIKWAQSILLLVWFAGYGLTIGPIPYVIAAEIGATRLRTKTLSVARNFYYLLQLVNAVVAPYMLNPANGNLKGKAAFPAAAMSLVCLVWAWFRLPESKNRTYAELDILFQDKVPARKFKGRVIESYERY